MFRVLLQHGEVHLHQPIGHVRVVTLGMSGQGQQLRLDYFGRGFAPEQRHAREEFVKDVTKNLENAFNGRGVVLERVLLRNVELPEKVRAAIDEKIASEQRAQQMVYVLQKEKQEAERKRVEAQGISDYNKIVSQSITDQVLQLKGIEATLELAKSNNSKTVIMNGKNMPLIFGSGSTGF